MKPGAPQRGQREAHGPPVCNFTIMVLIGRPCLQIKRAAAPGARCKTVCMHKDRNMRTDSVRRIYKAEPLPSSFI